MARDVAGIKQTLRPEIVELYDRSSQPGDDGMQVPSEYLLTIARLPQ